MTSKQVGYSWDSSFKQKTDAKRAKKKDCKGGEHSRTLWEFVALKWCDKKQVTMLSTFHNDTVTEADNRKGRKSRQPCVTVDRDEHVQRWMQLTGRSLLPHLSADSTGLG